MSMGEGKHTAGPWRIEAEPYLHVRSDDGCVFASDYTTDPNARLIAAAPDLLEACRCALGMLTGNMDGDWSLGEPRDMLRAAIAKALDF